MPDTPTRQRRHWADVAIILVGLGLFGLANARMAVHADLLVLSARLAPMPAFTKQVVVTFDVTSGRQHVIADSDAGPLFPVEVAVHSSGIFVVDEGQHGTAADKLWRFELPK